jgi:hypothetical protein
MSDTRMASDSPCGMTRSRSSNPSGRAAHDRRQIRIRKACCSANRYSRSSSVSIRVAKTRSPWPTGGGRWPTNHCGLCVDTDRQEGVGPRVATDLCRRPSQSAVPTTPCCFGAAVLDCAFAVPVHRCGRGRPFRRTAAKRGREGPLDRVVLQRADGVGDLRSSVGDPAHALRHDSLADRPLRRTDRMESAPDSARNEETGQETHAATLAFVDASRESAIRTVR